MTKKSTPGFKNLVIDLPGAVITFEGSSGSSVETVCDQPIDHVRSRITATRILRWPGAKKPARHRGNSTVINSGDAIAIGHGSSADTGISDGDGPQFSSFSGPVTIAVPLNVVEQIVIKNAAGIQPSPDELMKSSIVIKDKR